MKEGWETKKLGEVCTTQPPRSEAKKCITDFDLVSFIPMENLGIGKKTFVHSDKKPLSQVIKSYTYFAENDVLLAKITPCFENGKLGIAKNLVNGIGFGSSEFIVFRPRQDLNNEWLYYFLSSDRFRNEGAARMSGAVGHKRIPKEFIETHKIPLPPLIEQKRLVSILDKSFEAINTAIANTKKSLENAKELFDSFLHDIFSRQGDGWVTTTLDKISENLDSKRIPITKSKRKSGSYPYYGASGIVDYVADYIFDGDALLVSEDGANLLARSTPIAFSVSGKYWVNNHAHILKFQERATQKYVEFYLESIKIDSYVTGAAQPKLNQKLLNTIPISIPKETSAQSRIIDKILELQTFTQELESTYQKKLTALEELKQSLLHQAFNGDL